ncbi:MAG: PIG-L family deacetylase [Actinobacteria bacterium]|nr:PIG-L family deacetylase [Actinomycetota bacterium]
MKKEIIQKNKENREKLRKVRNSIAAIIIIIFSSTTFVYCQKAAPGFLEKNTPKIQIQINHETFPAFTKITHKNDLPTTKEIPIVKQGSQILTGYKDEITPQIGKFISDDRILILAPHPDDEAIGTAGAIQEALKVGAAVNMVCLTNGDFDQSSMSNFKKKFPGVPGQFLLLGENRMKESIKGMEILGLKDNNLKFLGYPDFGTLNIFLWHWGTTVPYKSLLTRTLKVPYPECYSPGSEYRGENILNDLTSIIKEFQPTKIFVSSPVDLNRDHRALYLFLRVSLWDLEGKIKDPEVFTYLIHSKNWPVLQGYHPEKLLIPPNQSSTSEIVWSSLNLTSDETKKKYESIICYKSQLGFGPPYLVSFVGKNELFADFNSINLKNNSQNQIIWQIVSDDELFYSISNGFLSIKIIPKQKTDKNFIMSIYLLGYSTKTEFAEMPKIHLRISSEGIKIFNKNQEIHTSEVMPGYDGDSLIIKIPLTLLKNPKYILSDIETKTKYLSNNASGWRVLNID